MGVLVGTTAGLILPVTKVQTSAVRIAGAPSMSFFDIRGNDLLARNWRKMMTPKPTQEEIEDLCRDDESSGCTLDMIEELEKRQQMKTSSPPVQPRWSEEIDDAVGKPE